MSDTAFVPKNDDLETRVIRLVADGVELRVSKLNLTDRIDADLRLANEDMDELFEKLVEEFGTDFSEIEDYYRYYRDGGGVGISLDPEEEFVFLLGLSFAGIIVSIFWRRLREHFPMLHLWWVIPSLLVAGIAIWRIRRTRHENVHEPYKLQMTVGDLVETVRAGKWTPPKDIGEQICRLGQKRLVT